ELRERIGDGDDRLAEIAVLHAGRTPQGARARHVAAVGGSAGTVIGHGNLERLKHKWQVFKAIRNAVATHWRGGTPTWPSGHKRRRRHPPRRQKNRRDPGDRAGHSLQWIKRSEAVRDATVPVLAEHAVVQRADLA